MTCSRLSKSGELFGTHPLNKFFMLCGGCSKESFSGSTLWYRLPPLLPFTLSSSFYFFLISAPVRARAGDASWTATAFSFAIPSTTSLPVTPECPRTHVSSIWHMSFTDTYSSITSSTSLLVGFREKMDCRADCESVHSFTFVPFSLWGFKISHNSAACMATTSAWKTETSPRAPPPS